MDMHKWLIPAALLLASLVLVAGCAREDAVKEKVPAAEPAAAADEAQTGVESVSGDIEGLESLDEDLGLGDLESLDQDIQSLE